MYTHMLMQVLGWTLHYLLSTDENVSASASVLPSNFPNIEVCVPERQTDSNKRERGKSVPLSLYVWEGGLFVISLASLWLCESNSIGVIYLYIQWYVHSFETLMYEELRCAVSETVKQVLGHGNGSSDKHQAIDATTVSVSRLSEFYSMKLTSTVIASEEMLMLDGDDRANRQRTQYGSSTGYGGGGGSYNNNRSKKQREVGDMLTPSDLVLLIRNESYDRDHNNDRYHKSSVFGCLGIVMEDEVSDLVMESVKANLVTGEVLKRNVKVKLFGSEYNAQLRQLLEEVVNVL
jgi:hypothetical protein